MADTENHCLRKVSADSQIITTVGGICSPDNGEYFGDNVFANSTSLSRPTGIAVKSNGELLIADSDNQRIRRVATNGSSVQLQATVLQVFQEKVELPLIPNCMLQHLQQ